MPLPSPARDDRNSPVGETGNRNAEPGRASGRGAGTAKHVKTGKPDKTPGGHRKTH